MLSLRDLPEHQFEEHHDIVVHRSPVVVLDAVEAVEASEDALIGALIGLRQLPHRMFGKAETIEQFGLKDFTRLGRSDRHLAYGLVGRFWRLDSGLNPSPTAKRFGHTPNRAWRNWSLNSRRSRWIRAGRY